MAVKNGERTRKELCRFVYTDSMSRSGTGQRQDPNRADRTFYCFFPGEYAIIRNNTVSVESGFGSKQFRHHALPIGRAYTSRHKSAVQDSSGVFPSDLTCPYDTLIWQEISVYDIQKNQGDGRCYIPVCTNKLSMKS